MVIILEKALSTIMTNNSRTIHEFFLWIEHNAMQSERSADYKFLTGEKEK